MNQCLSRSPWPFYVRCRLFICGYRLTRRYHTIPPQYHPCKPSGRASPGTTEQAGTIVKCTVAAPQPTHYSIGGGTPMHVQTLGTRYLYTRRDHAFFVSCAPKNVRLHAYLDRLFKTRRCIVIMFHLFLCF